MSADPNSHPSARTVAPTETGEEYELRHYVSVLRRRKWSVVVPTLVLALVGLFLGGGSSKTFTSTAEVLVEPVAASIAGVSTADRSDTDAVLATEIAIMHSDEVGKAVADAYGGPVGVAITPVGDESSVAVVNGEARDSVTAQRLVQTYVDTYVEVRRAQLASALDAAQSQAEAQIAALDEKIAALAKPIADLDAAIIVTYDEVIRNGLENQRQELISQRNELVSGRAVAQAQLDSIDLGRTLNPSFGIDVLSDASRGVRGESGKRKQTAAAGGAAGIVVGLLLAFGREYFDDRLRTRRDVEAAGVAVVGVVPRMRRSATRLVSGDRADGAALESYRRIRALIEVSAPDLPCMIVVSSPNPGEGTTLTAVNLAVTLAATNQRVLLIDGNQHRPRVHDLFGLANDVGLTTAISRVRLLTDVVRPAPETPNLSIVTVGPAVADPAALLSGPAARQFFAAARTSADFVIVDAPPLLAIADSVVLAGLADRVLLVVRAQNTRARDLAGALDLLDQAGAPVVEAILNRAERKQAGLGDYGGARRSISREVSDQMGTANGAASRFSDEPGATPVGTNVSPAPD